LRRRRVWRHLYALEQLRLLLYECRRLVDLLRRRVNGIGELPRQLHLSANVRPRLLADALGEEAGLLVDEAAVEQHERLRRHRGRMADVAVRDHRWAVERFEDGERQAAADLDVDAAAEFLAVQALDLAHRGAVAGVADVFADDDLADLVMRHR